MNPKLRRYLDLEQSMLTLDAHGNPEADQIRDTMDALWSELSMNDRDWINARDLPPLGAELRLSIGAALFIIPRSSVVRLAPHDKWEFKGWLGSVA